MKKFPNIILTILLGFSLSSCDKGYQVRFSNLYIEPMDSMVIEGSKIIFTKIGLQQTTTYSKISKGKYPLTFITNTKKVFHSTLNIPSTGTGKMTIQIDGIKQVSILED